MVELKTLIEEKCIRKRIAQLANKIDEDYAGEELVLVCILTGSVYFFVDLSRQLKTKHKLEFIKVSSYSGTHSTGDINMLLDVKDENVIGKNVLIVEDIIDTGTTLDKLCQRFANKNIKSLKLCTLLDKKEGRQTDTVHVDYVGFEIPNEFVVGYGLDLDGEYRNIAEVKYFTDKCDKQHEIVKSKINTPLL